MNESLTPNDPNMPATGAFWIQSHATGEISRCIRVAAPGGRESLLAFAPPNVLFVRTHGVGALSPQRRAMIRAAGFDHDIPSDWNGYMSSGMRVEVIAPPVRWYNYYNTWVRGTHINENDLDVIMLFGPNSPDGRPWRDQPGRAQPLSDLGYDLDRIGNTYTIRTIGATLVTDTPPNGATPLPMTHGGLDPAFGNDGATTQAQAEAEAEVTPEGVDPLHAADIETIGQMLMDEADRRGWCSEYDEIVDRINERLTVPLPVRMRTIDAIFRPTTPETVACGVSVPLATLSSTSAAEAYLRANPPEGMEFVRLA